MRKFIQIVNESIGPRATKQFLEELSQFEPIGNAPEKGMGKQQRGVPDLVITALIKACDEVRDPYAQTYLFHMEQAFHEYGIDGLQTQILYFLTNARAWRAPVEKKILLKYAKSKFKK